MLSIVMVNFIMLSESRNAERHFGAIMLNGITVSVVMKSLYNSKCYYDYSYMLSLIMLNVIILIVSMPSVIKLSAAWQNVLAPSFYHLFLPQTSNQSKTFCRDRPIQNCLFIDKKNIYF
jgi:hypothetical protein